MTNRQTQSVQRTTLRQLYRYITSSHVRSPEASIPSTKSRSRIFNPPQNRDPRYEPVWVVDGSYLLLLKGPRSLYRQQIANT